jgi:Family of unknown function (DUF6518)
LSPRARIAVVALAAFAFGVVAALVEGKSGGQGGLWELRNSLGNLSTPYLVIAFVAGTMCARLSTGALAGLGATSAALLGYYLVSAAVVGELAVFSSNRGYLQGGVITGLAFGALGAWWAQRRELSASIVAGVLLMAEPLVLLALGAFGPEQLGGDGGPTLLRVLTGWGLTLDRGAVPIAVYAFEFLVGLAVVVVVLVTRPRTAQPG